MNHLFTLRRLAHAALGCLCLLGVALPHSLHAQEFTKYLFAYFPSNNNENVYYALSDNGYDYTPMNDGQRVVWADTISIKKGVRDPHILRGEDGYFYMVLTDMRSADGWESNRGIVMMKSKDMVNWTHSTVNFPTKYKGTIFEKVIRVWAPETIYDPQAQKYMVYFSLFNNNADIPYDKVYYCYANEDFTDLEGEPTFLFDRGSATIDMDIVYNVQDGLYHGFYKNEAPLGQSDPKAGEIHKVTASTLTAPDGQAPGSQWSAPSDKLQQTNEAVEGAGVFHLINEDKWVLMYDCYMKGYYQFCTSDDLSTFSFKQNTATSGAFTPRHGTVIPVTDAEIEAINKYFYDKKKAKYVEALQQEVVTARSMGLDVTRAEALLAQDDSTIEDLQAAAADLNVQEYAYVTTRYPEDKTSLIGTWTKTNENDNKGQHWDGTSKSSYYEQNQGWGDVSWKMSMTQQVTLPAGYYALKASGRSASEAVVATMSVDQQSVRFPTKADVGYGITTDGTASFDATKTFANGGKGRGWEWRYITFHLEQETTVTITLQASVQNARYQWVSICNLSLLYNENDPANMKTVTVDDSKGEPEIYTISGQRLGSTRHGVNLIHHKGMTEKVIVR